MTACPHCGLKIYGNHKTAEDCLTHLVPRYARAQSDVKRLHGRYQALEERIERMKIRTKAMDHVLKQARKVDHRLLRLESAFGGGK